jgi:hypothetical protein
MRKLRLVVTLLVLSFPLPGHSNELAGLWKAKKRFGPDTNGTIVVSRNGQHWTADLAGRTLPVTNVNGELSFALPGSEGSFKGALDDKGTLSGRWMRGGTPVNGIGRRFVIAYPVNLEPDGANRWRGTLSGSQDAFTFYLLIEPQADGSLRAVLRNPEFDLGTQQGIERLVRDGNALKLMGRRRGKEQEVATGTYDAETGVMTLLFQSRGGSYDFYREGDDSAFHPRGKHPERYVYRQPVALNDGWPVSTLDAVNIDRATIEKFVQNILDVPMNSQDAQQNHALLIARHGKLVLEEYFHEQTRETLHTTRSAGKSFTALLVGAVMQAGIPLQLSSPVYRVMNGGE